MKMLIALLFLIPALALADTPPSNTVNAKVQDGSGNAIGSTAGSLNVNVTGGGSGGGTVDQGNKGTSGNAWYVQGSLGRTWSLLNSTDSVNVGNWPSTFAVTGTFFQATQPVSIATMPTTPVTGTFFQTTQPVSLSSIPLPTGAATSALQTTGNSSLSTIATDVGNIPAQGQALAAASLPVVLTAAQVTTLTPPTTITANLGTLNGAATAALQGTTNTDLATINTTLGSPFQSGGSIGNSSFGISGTLPGFASTPTFNLGTLNGAATAALQSTANTDLAAINTTLGSPMQTSGGSVTANLGTLNGAATASNQTTGNSSLSTIATDVANIVPTSTTTTCTLTNSGDNGCTIATNGSSTLIVGSTGTWGGLVGVQCSGDGSFYELIPVFDYGTRTAQLFMSEPADNGSSNIGGCLKVQLHAYSGLGGTGTFTINMNAGLGALNVTSSGPAQFYTTANISDTNSNGITSTLVGSDQALDVHLANSSVAITASALPLPTGAATSALQTTANTDLATINTTLGSPMQASGGSIVNVSGTVSLPTGAATAAKQPALGTAGTASSDVITVQGKSGMTALVVDPSGVTSPVSAASLPLPTGAATSALQTTANTDLATINTTLGSPMQASGGTVAVTQATASNLNANVSGTVSAKAATPTALTVYQALLSIGTTAVILTHGGGAVASTRVLLTVQLLATSTSTCFIGSSSVTTSGSTQGVQIFAGQTVTFNNDAGSYYAICSNASQSVLIMEQE